MRRINVHRHFPVVITTRRYTSHRTGEFRLNYNWSEFPQSLANLYYDPHVSSLCQQLHELIANCCEKVNTATASSLTV